MGEIIAFANDHPYLASLVVAFTLGVLAYEIRLKGRGLVQVSTNMAVQLINKGATIIDVRPSEAYMNGHIVNAKNIPLDRIVNDPAVVKKSKNKILLTVDDNGSIASRAAEALRKAGYEAVYSLQGGLNAWRTDNLPLVK
ncbi:MAG: rhodanese-like domain-containing protein [Gammaproteobacteria bacterium]|nr:rhodanese-like domain-containing protein [Gammaproteobacteria bacterium]